MTQRDKIYSKPQKKISKFIFDKRVARVFDDMINRSVPGYSDIIQMCGVLAACSVASVTGLGSGCTVRTFAGSSPIFPTSITPPFI